MRQLLVVGSMAFDTVRTPFGEVTEALGGVRDVLFHGRRFFFRRQSDCGGRGGFSGGACGVSGKPGR